MKGENDMARFTADNIDKYGGQGGNTSYFKLSDDGDIARVRFLYNSADDIDGYAVHELKKEGDKKGQYINCLREYNQPIDDCPFCRAGYGQIAKIFVPIYNEDEQKVQIWERGKKFYNKLSSICSRYGKNPIVSQTFEIERNGKKGEQTTTYEVYRTDDAPDDARLEDYDMPQIVGKAVLDKSADDMEFYLENGMFPPEDEPVRRSSRREEEPVRRDSRRSRRTPSDTF